MFPVRTTFFVLLALCGTIQSANILAFFSIPSISHQIVFQPIWKELSLRGHKVTVVTPNPLNDPTLTNLTEIDVSFSYEFFKSIADNQFSRAMDHWKFEKWFHSMMVQMNELQFSHPQIKELLQDKTKNFDVVLAEPWIPFPAAFSHRFNCPWISVLSMDAPTTTHYELGNPQHPVLHTNCIAAFGEDKTFFERVDAVLFHVWTHYNYQYNRMPMYDKYVRKYFGKDMPYFGDILKNASMLFLNTDPIVQKPRALQTNVVELHGRLHIKPKKPLPKELKDFLDRSSDGVIYFSFGSNVKGAEIHSDKRKIFMETFAELPYSILWKFEEDHMENKSSNVKISKWLPQQDILGHPNVKLFITQAGFQSLEEAIVNKVPLLAIPFIADQHFNGHRVATLGIGRNLDFHTLTKKDFKQAILEIMENPKYKEKITEISKIGEDQPMTGLEKAIWWTEYVIRNRGAKYLKSTDYDFPWYKFLLLDVISFFIAIMALFTFVTYQILKYLNSAIKVLVHNGNKKKTL